jgi:hypothetical protein
MIKWLAYFVAIVLILAGALFALQGLRFLPSRVMYGRPEWVIIGGAMVAAGVALIAFTALRAARRRP